MTNNDKRKKKLKLLDCWLTPLHTQTVAIESPDSGSHCISKRFLELMKIIIFNNI